MINYADNISKYFAWHEALLLPSWQAMHIPTQQEIDNITKSAQMMDIVREYLNTPLIVHVWLRPILNNPSSSHNGQDYNAFIGGAPNSAHKIGLAVDFNPKDMTCEQGRQLLLPKLEEFNIRMENNGVDANWIHLDLAPVVHSRFFIP